MINRAIIQKFREYNKYFQVINITGPRQSGKSTFIQNTAGQFPYVNLESPDEREFATTDPKNFLQRFPKGAIIDEVQYAPELFSYIQVLTDANRKLKFYLTGSQNFLMQEKISQSLAGRIGMLTLLPFSYSELAKAKIAFPDNLYRQEFTGFYPRIYDRNIPPREFYRNYVNTYIERDVQGLIHTSNLLQFNRFISLVAGRAGQIVNFQSLASDTGVSPSTIQTWLRILEKSYVIFLLPPYHTNFNKRIIKSPKLYFYDTGLLCYLLNITAPDQLATHFAKGAVFENYVLAEVLKTRFNKGLDANMYFWKDNHDKEIDCLLETQDGPLAIEIKSAATFTPSFMDNVRYWQELSPSNNAGAIVYGGIQSYARENIQVVAWNRLEKLPIL
ncbi:ATP-binding protein [Puia sp. P3]|uniref:ATP-binding protein n=1 Tax=Puia sp. P3 TaxID=3423952 RepID=UPI003D66C0C2